MERGVAVVHISPAGGAAFTQYTAELEPGGSLGPTTNQRFLYALEGVVDFATDATFHTLTAGSFAYIPEDASHTITAQQMTRLVVIEKPFEFIPSVSSPEVLVGHEEKTLSVPLNDDPDLQVRSLLPSTASFDFAVNTMTYQPGAALSMVEVHVMEHGLLMLEGGGIYRLGDQWYPVTAGDFIWMGPYCPQWFGAIGKCPAKYLIYKDWNRHPLV
jgi:(S)-ureidoglycine aminohydrolase